jgi:triacylglycerol lipase
MNSTRTAALRILVSAAMAALSLFGSAAQAPDLGTHISLAQCHRWPLVRVDVHHLLSFAARGFGGGTVYYPSTAGSYGVIAMCPGFTATQSSNRVVGSAHGQPWLRRGRDEHQLHPRSAASRANS